MFYLHIAKYIYLLTFTGHIYTNNASDLGMLKDIMKSALAFE